MTFLKLLKDRKVWYGYGVRGEEERSGGGGSP